eukprot:c54025_g1_i1.p1 GENE.c54025_g1_i1~~c54025_g1_i1.p1  ORF type:complete len:277 (+),score=26.45 c54025_g1_i1:87-917(+)
MATAPSAMAEPVEISMDIPDGWTMANGEDIGEVIGAFSERDGELRRESASTPVRFLDNGSQATAFEVQLQLHSQSGPEVRCEVLCVYIASSVRSIEVRSGGGSLRSYVGTFRGELDARSGLFHCLVPISAPSPHLSFKFVEGSASGEALARAVAVGALRMQYRAVSLGPSGGGLGIDLAQLRAMLGNMPVPAAAETFMQRLAGNAPPIEAADLGQPEGVEKPTKEPVPAPAAVEPISVPRPMTTSELDAIRMIVREEVAAAVAGLEQRLLAALARR